MKTIKNVHFLLLVLVALLSANDVSALSPNKASKQKWYSASTANLTVISDDGAQQAVKLAQNLERFRSLYEILSNQKLDKNIRPVKLFATKRTSTFDLFRDWMNLSKNTVGYFSDTVNGNYSVLKLKSNNKNQLSILFHNYTQYLSANLSSENHPLWYNEGSAAYMAEIEFVDDKTVLYGKHNARYINNIRNMDWMPLEVLLSANNIGLKNRKQRYKINSQGWLLVHYLNSTEELIKQKKVFLNLLNSGVKPKQALEESLDVSFSEFEKALKKYSRQRRFKYKTISIRNTFDNNEIKVNQLTADEVVYQLGDLALQNRGGYDQARPFFEKAISLNSSNANALAGLANTYLGSDDEKMASLIKKAKKVDPKNPWVATVSGHLNNRRFRMEENIKRKNLYRNQAVQDFNIAINSGKMNVEAIYGASTFYLIEKDYSKALELAMFAYDLAPSNHKVRTRLISLFLANKETPKALNVYNKVVNHHHGSEQSIVKFEKWYNDQLKYWAEYHKKQKSPSSAQAS